MTQGDLAYRLRELSGGRVKTTQSQISNWERGVAAPSSIALPFIAEATGHAIEFFYTSGPGEDDDEQEAALPSYHEFLEAIRPVARLFEKAEQ